MNIIAKKDLIPGAWYLAASIQRGMPIGWWDDHKQKFICIKPPTFGQYSIYEMNHIEDDDGYVCFEPVSKIELPKTSRPIIK